LATLLAPPDARTQRRLLLDRLDRETFDLVIVGGGVVGAGIARDAALRGLKVALLEKNDFGSGTSSRSSKLVHGGLRYLQQIQLKLVFEGTNERALLMQMAPHLVRPQEFLIPAYRRSFMGLISLGLMVYDLLALHKPPAGHERHTAADLEDIEPGLRQERLVGGITYYDCATDDARLTLENILDARDQGAACLNYVRALAPIRRPSNGRVIGVTAEDMLTGRPLHVRARVVVGALGPWTDQVLEAFGTAQGRRLLRPTKGVHVLVDAARLPVRRAVTMATRDQRVVFCIPAGHRTVIGTTDTDYRGDYDHVTATQEDVIYLLATANFYFPNVKLRIDDVISTWAGLRPLIAASGAASSVSREHEIFEEPDGMIVIAGGKLTTFRRMSREVVDRTVSRLAAMGFGEDVRPCSTFERRLPRAFANGDSALAVADRLVRSRSLDPESAHHLAQTYGSHAERVLESGSIERIDPELPHLWCEVNHAIESDLAVTVLDVLWRRVPLYLLARDQGLGVCEDVAARIADVHGLSATERERQIAEFEARVAESRAFRTPTPNSAAG
jgi:glycerol-3-phosphate dehydrogenase